MPEQHDLKSAFLQHKISCSTEVEKAFLKFLEIFMEWNMKINLSALRNEKDVIEKHFIDSLLVTQFFNFSGQKILDLGTGGGFPSIPLSLYYQHNKNEVLDISSMDATRKKIVALQDMSQILKASIQTLNGRAEDFGNTPKYREKFDIVLTRAFAPWPVLLELALPFLKVGGKLIAYQSPAIKEDVENFKNVSMKLGGGDIKIHSCFLGEDIERIFVEVSKTKPCPKSYPRKTGIPKKTPLS
ncbi:16S rRNA (guanine(527)-N(7))-methyltransferase RsmG [Candidatus Peregrinibacteria bacterium]|jgi:16S rRNA (guanine527-N7)-methyltransferase|nr:16S rRNA (guanine(527)-N(7))-methyltransferase RsmG [Candidatus Peregrinibacteria bacterium]